MRRQLQMSNQEIEYSEKYFDDEFEYRRAQPEPPPIGPERVPARRQRRAPADPRRVRRHVIMPKHVAKNAPKGRLLTESEWRGLGVQQSRGWVHYACHRRAPRPARRDVTTRLSATAPRAPPSMQTLPRPAQPPAPLPVPPQAPHPPPRPARLMVWRRVAGPSRTSCSSAGRTAPTRRPASSTASASTPRPARSSDERALSSALPSGDRWGWLALSTCRPFSRCDRTVTSRGERRNPSPAHCMQRWDAAAPSGASHAATLTPDATTDTRQTALCADADKSSARSCPGAVRARAPASERL